MDATPHGVVGVRVGVVGVGVGVTVGVTVGVHSCTVTLSPSRDTS